MIATRHEATNHSDKWKKWCRERIVEGRDARQNQNHNVVYGIIMQSWKVIGRCWEMFK